VRIDDFDGAGLDADAWIPHYLPAWNSRSASAATFTVRNSVLTLSIPVAQGLWCAGDHEPPLRVSGIQWSTGDDVHLVPTLSVDRIWGSPGG
jgi:hypothetical protein